MATLWGDIGLIFFWEAASAIYREQELKVGSRPAVSEQYENLEYK